MFFRQMQARKLRRPERQSRDSRSGLRPHRFLPVTLKNPPCPWLPEVADFHDFTLTRRHGHAKGAVFYLDALRYAQSQWLAGKPAQAILQLNKAWMADLSGSEPELLDHPPPYQALAWILENAAGGHCGYLGNPVRHFQHLASRISGPRAEIRSWRAWVCFHLAERTLNRAGFPRDGGQIAREGLWIPNKQRALNEVANRGWPGEERFCKGCRTNHEIKHLDVFDFEKMTRGG